MGRYFKSLIPFLILLILLLPAAWSLFHPGFFVSDDGEWMIIRFSAFYQALVEGQFPVRWLQRLNHGYGYPVANFLYPGFMYLATPIHFLGFGFVETIKIVLGLSLIFSGIFTYFWLKENFGRFPATIGALFYTYVPYHLYDLYKRGSVGEMLALAIVPLFLWAIDRKKLLLAGFAYAALITSHNTLALLFTPLLVVYVLLTSFSSYFVFLIGLGLSAFFWLPAIFDLQFTVFSKSPVITWQDVLFTPKYFQLLGFPSASIFVLNSFFIKKLKRKDLLFWGLFLFSLLLTFPQTRFLWRILPLSSFVQFSFRFFSLIILATAYLSALVIFQFSKQARVPLGVILIGLLLIFSSPFAKPEAFFDKGEGFYATNEATTTVQDEYMPIWVKVKPSERPKEKIEMVEGEAEIEILQNAGRQIEFKTDSTMPTRVRVNTLYYPGWQVLVDGKRAKFSYQNEKGVIEIPINEGEHQILVEFRETPFRTFSDIISLITLGVVIIISVPKFRLISHG